MERVKLTVITCKYCAAAMVDFDQDLSVKHVFETAL